MNPEPNLVAGTGCDPHQLPKLRLDFYNTAVLMSQWEENGRTTTYPVSVHDVVSACTDVELNSGLLPPNTLFWKQRGNQVALGIYMSARRWNVQTEDRNYHIPMPPFVFVGKGSSYRIFAVKKRPLSEQTCLYHAPCPNVHATGGICQGNTPFPTCSPQTILQALQCFMEGSLFNGDLSRDKCQSYPDDVRQLWEGLNGRKRFPLSELVPMQMKLWNLM
jgi:PRTRC genetic system protein B